MSSKNTCGLGLSFLGSCMFIFGCDSPLEDELMVQEAVDEARSAPLLPVDPESICGETTDWQDVNDYDGTLGPTELLVANTQTPVGRIRWRDDLADRYDGTASVNGIGWCSGTLIAPDLFLTAGHCFDEGSYTPVFQGTDTPIPPELAAMEMVVEFNYENAAGGGELEYSKAVDILELEEYRRGGLDYAVLRLGEVWTSSPGYAYGIAHVTSELPEPGDETTIIQHPEGIPKVVESGFYAGRADGGTLDGYIQYEDLDTRGGSSGSGVLDQYGRLYGVHTNAGCYVDGGANHGVAIADILEVSNLVEEHNVRIRARGNVTSQGEVYAYCGGDECRVTGDWDRMNDGCTLQCDPGDMVYLRCATNGQRSRSVEELRVRQLEHTTYCDDIYTCGRWVTLDEHGIDAACQFTD